MPLHSNCGTDGKKQFLVLCICWLGLSESIKLW